MIVELSRLDEVRSACGDDDLLMWAAQGLSDGVRVWAAGDGVVAASPGLSRRDRLAVWGGAACATRLVRHALGEMGPSYRPVGGRPDGRGDGEAGRAGGGGHVLVDERLRFPVFT
ncbi:hypothetical protein ACIBO2_31650 [Nonomuraea sp. NPDC050022]|uniref:hypothetical protein n=1 Tax=unclassified Nonomuraea TaxID=2593643 RepID=UPI00341114C2